LKENKLPLVSIITVVYNGEAYLEQTIDSVLNQSYKNIEYIIVDGGSTDGTLDILKKYGDKITKWISEPDKGLYDAMNKGIGMTNGALIGMINSDDWYELDAVEQMVDAYNNNPTKTIFHADRYDVEEDGSRKVRKFHPSAFKLKYYGMTYNHPSMFITPGEYEKHLYNTKLRSMSDFQFVLEAYLRDEETLFYLDNAIVNYRLDGISSQLSLWNSLKEGFSVRKISGMNIFENVFSFFVKIIVNIINRLRKI
jgi:glycosyltransferase involved in cell wall biosynthesis